MADANPELLGMIESVANALGPDLCARTAFVGGVTTGLLVTDDFAKETVRLTDDVDLIIDVASYGKWALFQDELRRRGFRESSRDDVICRMRLGDLKVDFMPNDPAILGFSNRWYEQGLKTATDFTLKPGVTIRILTPPLFVATKLEAFIGRGNGDFLESRDIEDILVLIDGRRGLVSEIAAAPLDLRTFIADQFRAHLEKVEFQHAVAGNIRDRRRIVRAFECISSVVELTK